MKCQVMVDWLTFSVKLVKDPAEVIKKYLGMDPALFQDAGYGLLGYQRVLRFSDICVCYEPRENDYFKDMGVCVSMSGNGCRAFETMSKLTMEGAKDKQGRIPHREELCQLLIGGFYKLLWKNAALYGIL